MEKWLEFSKKHDIDISVVSTWHGLICSRTQTFGLQKVYNITCSFLSRRRWLLSLARLTLNGAIRVYFLDTYLVVSTMSSNLVLLTRLRKGFDNRVLRDPFKDTSRGHTLYK